MLASMLPVFHQMVILFILIGVGFAAGKTKIMTVKGNKVLALVINGITNPCNILYAAVCTDHAFSNAEVLTLFVFVFILFGVMIAVAQIVPHVLRVPKGTESQYKFMMIFSNLGYMGIPVVSSIFGDTALICVAIFMMVFQILCYSYGIYLIRGGKGSGFRPRDLISPMFISSGLGLILYLTGVRVPLLVEDTLNTLRCVTTPCAMLIIGCALSAVPFRVVFSNWRMYIVSALKLLVVPVLAWFLLRNFIPNQMLLGVTIVMLAMPVASNFTILSAQYDRDQTMAASAVFLSTLLSVITIPVLVGLLSLR